jgi:hypothetical protein
MYLPVFINIPLIFSWSNPSLTFKMPDVTKGAKTKKAMSIVCVSVIISLFAGCAKQTCKNKPPDAKPKQTFTADWESLKKCNPAPSWFCYAKSAAGETSPKGGFDAEQDPAGATQEESGPGRI